MAGKDRRTIGDYFELCRGNTYKSALLGQPGPILLGLGSIQRNGGFRSDSLKTYGGESPERLLVRPGELYLSLKDVTQSGDLLGAVAKLPNNQPAGRLTQDTVKLEPIGNDVPASYLYWLLRTPQYRSYCRSHATGTTNLGLAREDFLSFPASEPTQQQSHLAELFDALEDKIELNRRMNETLEAIARAMFKSWFVDFDPVRAKVNGEPPESICRRLRLTTDLLALFPDRLAHSELGEIPEGWGIGTIGDHCNLNEKSWTAKTIPHEVHYVDLANTKDGIISEVKSFRSSEAPSRARRILRAGDTIVGTVRPGNRSFSLIGESGPALTGSTGFAVLSPRRKELRELVYFIATDEENIGRLSRLADGAAYPAVRPEVVTAGKCVIPSARVLDAFHALVAPMINSVIFNRDNNEVLSDIRDALLPKLLSGELRVPDLTHKIEKATA